MKTLAPAAAEGPASTQVHKVFLILLDISGYTRFIKLHKLSLIHAEKIIDELLEHAIAEVHAPLVMQELEGDAVYFYALSDGTPEMALEVVRQVKSGLAAFKKREAELISECEVCFCEACRTVGHLSMKAVVHHGEAVFTQVRQFAKVSGEDVIIAHVLLKAAVKRREYVLVTESMRKLIGDREGPPAETRTEHCGELGPVNISVYYPPQPESPVLPAKVSMAARLRMLLLVEWHLLKRFFMPASKRYRNLDAAQGPR